MPSLTKNRIESLDFLKGLVMVLMALDHTKDFFYKSPGLLDITNPANATVGAYLTRWVTHFCAPSFCFLAGLSAFMIGIRKSKIELSLFLLQRGIWLIFIETTVIAFAWYFDIRFHNTDLATIWSLGMGMIALAAIIRLPKNLILLFSLLLICCHNLLDAVHFDGNILWSILHEFNSFEILANYHINVVYPLIPWIGVMSLGYYFGNFYNKSFDPMARKKLFNQIGLAAIIGFFILRFINVYGDLNPWKHYDTTTQTIMSFMNLNKYPPSLLYLLITLGGAILFLANAEKLKGKIVDFFIVFGRVPFFYYIIHLYAIHILAAILAEMEGYGWKIMIQYTFDPDLKGFGYNLPLVCLIWIGIVLALYPLCKKFDTYKQNNKDKWWLSYL
ncbi:MAG: heparan-alpha-glucosaminide N-acetyltransferase domain-containing protein [Ferruginibacter sp.]